jgi:hypothetical protein
MIYESGKPWFKKERISYNWLIQEYKSGKIEVDWKANLPFVEFVAGLPEDFLKLQVLPARTRNFSSSGAISAQEGKFLDPVIQSKKNLRSDFSGFYDSLTGESGDGGWYSPDSKEVEINKACDNLSRWIEELKIEEKRSRDLVALPTEIQAEVCVEGYNIVYQLRLGHIYSPKGWRAKFDRVWRRLSRLENESSGEREKEAIRYYKQEMRKMRAGRFDEIIATDIGSSKIAGQ